MRHITSVPSRGARARHLRRGALGVEYAMLAAAFLTLLVAGAVTMVREAANAGMI